MNVKYSKGRRDQLFSSCTARNYDCPECPLANGCISVEYFDYFCSTKGLVSRLQQKTRRPYLRLCPSLSNLDTRRVHDFSVLHCFVLQRHFELKEQEWRDEDGDDEEEKEKSQEAN